MFSPGSKWKIRPQSERFGVGVLRHASREDVHRPSESKTQPKKETIIAFKILCSVGEITSTVNLKVDVNTTAETFMEKILRRFPETETSDYGLFVPLENDEEGGIWLEETKPLADYEPIFEESEV